MYEHCWVTPGAPLSGGYTGYKAHLTEVFRIDRINTLEAPVSRLAKTLTSIRNRNQNSFSARVLGGKFWSQTKRRGGSLKDLAFSQLRTWANPDGGRMWHLRQWWENSPRESSYHKYTQGVRGANITQQRTHFYVKYVNIFSSSSLSKLKVKKDCKRNK